MKVRFIVLLAVLLLGLVFVGCAKKEATASAQVPQEPTLSPVMRLLIGTFRLEGTEDAITKEQAAELLPLWKGYRALSQSDTAIAAEIEGLIKQIEETMTPAQRQKIAAMNLSYADLQAIAEERGISLGGRFGAGPGLMATRAAQSGGQSRQGATGAPMPPGGPGDGAIFFGGPMGGQTQGQGVRSGTGLSAEAVATLQARASTRVPTALLDALIALLQERAGIAP